MMFKYTLTAKDGAELCFYKTEPVGTIRGVICLVHGLGDYSGCFSYLIDFFSKASFAVMAIDLHGNGASSGSRGHIANFEILYDDIELLLKQAKENFPSAPIFLYGHSLGGNLVLNYALKRQPDIAGVIAASPWIEVAENPLLKRWLAYVLDVFAPNYIIDAGIDASKLSHDPSFVESYAQDPLVHGLISVHLLASSCRSGLWAVKHAGEFNLPLLLMQGSSDFITSIKATKRFFERAPKKTTTFKIWNGDFHSLHNEANREEIFNFVLSFIESLLKPTA
jgi:alpha-beta hydrolase superfamily lysophospholipase